MNSTYLMKEKKDEKKMEEHIKKNVNAMKNAMKNYKKLIAASENYCKSELVHATQTKTLSESLVMQSNTGIADLDQGLNSIIDILDVMFAGRNETTQFFNDQIIPILKKNGATYPLMISNFEKRYENDCKRAVLAVSQAEKKMKAQPTEITKIMEEVKQADALKQQSTVQGLQDTTKMVRELYCGLIQLFCNLFEKEKNSLQQIVDVLRANEAEIQKMAAATENFGEEVGELIKAKKQVLIDLKKLTPELKAVLKAAGLKRKDLCNPETVKLLISTVEQAVKEGKCDQSVLDQLTAAPGSENSLVKTTEHAPTQINSEFGEFEELDLPSSHSRNVSSVPQPTAPAPTTPKIEQQPAVTPPTKQTEPTQQPSDKRPPPPAPTRKNPPPPTPNRGGNVPPPPSNIPPPPSNVPPPPSNVPPPPSNVPPPPSNIPPPPSNVPPPSVSPKPVSGGRSFLDDINKGGHTLKKTEAVPEKKMTVAQQGDLTSMLASAMANRRKDIEVDDNEEEEDEDEWSD